MRAVLVGLELLSLAWKTVHGRERDRRNCALSLGSIKQLRKEMGDHSGKVCTWEGSRMQFWGILLNSKVLA